MRQPVWLPHFLEERCDHAPISVSLWAVDAHLWRAGDGRTGLRPAGCSAALQALRTVPGRLRLPVYFGGGGALVGAKLLYLLPLLPRLAVELPLLWEEPGEFYARYLSGGMVFYGGFFGGVAAAWGAAKYLRLRLSDFFPVLVPPCLWCTPWGRVGCFCAGCCYGRAAPPPWGIAFTHAIAGPNGVPLLPVQLWEAGAELVISPFCSGMPAGRRAGADAPGLCVLLCPGAVCVGVVSGGSGPGDVRALLHVSVAQLGCSGLGPGVACGGAEAQKIRP